MRKSILYVTMLAALGIASVGFAQNLQNDRKDARKGQGAVATSPCCSITAINATTGLVTAKVNANGNIFQFRVTNAVLLNSLQVGQGVYANFMTNQVSLDGTTICCNISAPPAPPPAPSKPAPSLSAAPAASPMAAGAVGNKTAPTPACCIITAIDKTTGVVTAKVNATGNIFQFKVTDFALLQSLRIGQGVYANFSTMQVSLDGNTACCPIINSGPPPPTPLSSANSGAGAKAGRAGGSGAMPGTPSPSSGPARLNAGKPDAARTPNPTAQDTGGKKPGVLGALPAGASGTNPNSFTIPPVSYGAPQSVQDSGGLRTDLKDSRGSINPNVVRLHGIDGIAAATGIPQAAKDFLTMHARTLPSGEVDNYVVNAKLAEEWFRMHPEPESVKKAAVKSDSHTGCNAISVHCAEEGAQHAADEAARQSQKLLEEARAEWNHVTGEVEHDWNMVEGCFTDNRLTLPGIPVKFSVTPQFPMNFETNGTTSNQYGSASGTINGSVVFGVPIQSDFTAQVDMFYIPCLPFAVRPRSIAASGKLDVGSTFEASAKATGKFNQTFTIPPAGGPHFPIEVIPIVIAGVPVAELDVSVYVDGRVLVDGEGKVGGAVSVKTMQDTVFDFACSGKACDLNQRSVPEPVSTTESARIDGRIHVKPEVYAALQLDFDIDLLTARAGPQPYLLGEIYGCAAASATQSAGQPTGGQESYALTSDLDWGIELRAEALVAEKKVAEKDWKLLQRHLYFKDLANSTALIPVLSGAAQPSLGQPALYTMKMPACYPYPDPLEYQVSWTGGATAGNAILPPPSTANGKLSGASVTKLDVKPVPKTTGSTPPASCTLQPGLGQCWSDPVNNLALGLTWPSAGSFAVTATPLRDQHGRTFDPSRTAQVTVSVQPPGANAPTANQGSTQAASPGLETPVTERGSQMLRIDPCAVATADILSVLLETGIQGYFPYEVQSGGEHIRVSNPKIEQVNCPHMTIRASANIQYRQTRGFPQFEESGSLELQSPLTAVVQYRGTASSDPVTASNFLRAAVVFEDVRIISLQLHNVPNWIDVTWIRDCLNGQYSNWGCRDLVHEMRFDVTNFVKLYLEQGHTLTPSVSTATAPQGVPSTTVSSLPAVIIRVDSRTGLVTAQDNATGRKFQFLLDNPGLASSLPAGTVVHADLNSQQVSLNGTSSLGTMVSPLLAKLQRMPWPFRYPANASPNFLNARRSLGPGSEGPSSRAAQRSYTPSVGPLLPTQSYTFQDIVVPGASTVYGLFPPGVPYAINDAGEIVGDIAVLSADNWVGHRTLGFLKAGDQYTIIDGTLNPIVKSAAGKSVLWVDSLSINSKSQIIGSYAYLSADLLSSTPGADVSNGYLLNEWSRPGTTKNFQNFVTADDPGACSGSYEGTAVMAINSSGQMAGSASNGDNCHWHSFLYSGGAFKILEALDNIAWNVPQAISEEGEVLGFLQYFSGGYHGFRFANGNLTTVDFPGASDTFIFGINRHGQIVGTFKVAGGSYQPDQTHCFLEANGSFTQIDAPDSDGTVCYGINARGQIVGVRWKDYELHGFVATPSFTTLR